MLNIVMKKNYFITKKLHCCLLFFMIMTATISAQVGVGTITPDASSVLDVSSTTQGMLAPRMTTAQKNAISSPADGLLVYDTDLKAFCNFNSTTNSWTVIGANSSQRNKFKRIRSTDALATVLAAEKAAGGNTKYLLDSETLYEINGAINVDLPIDLNNAYVSGLDANEDKLIKASGNLFEGATGGSVRNLTITANGGGMVYNLNGTTSQTAVMRECVVSGSSNVGIINGFGIALFTTVIYSGNSNGIIYSNIGRVLLTNNTWFGNNAGTYEKFIGSFNVISRQGGLYEVNGTSVGLDVSANPIINNDADVVDVIFSGSLTTGKYVNGYTVGSYPGYNFDRSWNVRAQGIPNESDEDAQGELSIDYPVGSGAPTSFNGSTPSNIVKVQGVSTSVDLFRFSKGTGPHSDNRIVYEGKRRRYFNFSGSISFQVPAIGTYIVYVAKNGNPVSRYKVYGRSAAVNDIIAVSIDGVVELGTNDYLEIYMQRFNGNDVTIITPNATLIVN